VNYYDDIHHRVREMDRAWDRRVSEIRADVARARAGIATPTKRTYSVSILGDPGEPALGRVTVNDRGDLQAIDLDAYAVHGMYSDRVAAAIVTAINTALRQAITTRTNEGVK